MPNYTLKIVSRFSSFDDVEARKIAKILQSALEYAAPNLGIEVRLMQERSSENIMKRVNTTEKGTSVK